LDGPVGGATVVGRTVGVSSGVGDVVVAGLVRGHVVRWAGRFEVVVGDAG
jgi:hypothetical protein